MANTYDLNFIKIGGIWFFRGQNYWISPYIVANTYGLNLIEIEGISIIVGGGRGGRNPLLYVYIRERDVYVYIIQL